MTIVYSLKLFISSRLLELLLFRSGNLYLKNKLYVLEKGVVQNYSYSRSRVYDVS